jgi:hypothetical protein
MQHKPLPELYAYIFRHIASTVNGSNVVTEAVLLQSIRKVVYKAPAPVYRYIITEYEQEYGVIKCISNNPERYVVILNEETRRRLNKLKEHVFPINV